MPPRVREVARKLLDAGFVEERKGKGDHVIYRHPVTGVVLSLDGGPNHEVPRGVWAKLKKRYGLSD